jgi:hypothetical protein
MEATKLYPRPLFNILISTLDGIFELKGPSSFHLIIIDGYD